MNNLALAVALATAPSSAFAELRERPRFWFPLLLLVAIHRRHRVLVLQRGGHRVAQGHSCSATTRTCRTLPEDKRAAAMAMIGRNTMLWGSVVGAIIVMPIVFLLSALYFLLAAKVTKLPQGFKHWFAFSLLDVAAAAAEHRRGGHLAAPQRQRADQPVRDAAAVAQRARCSTDPWAARGQSLLESLTIPSLLSWILMIIGVRAWSQRSWVFSAIFILLPTVCIYGIWAFFAFR